MCHSLEGEPGAAAEAGVVADGMPHRCLIKLQGMYPSLKRAERRASDYLLKHSKKVRGLSIVEFAAAAGCSEATVVRLAKRLGYAGYPDLKADFGGGEAVDAYAGLRSEEAPEAVARKVFLSSVRALQDTMDVVDTAQYRRALQFYLGARRLAFMGLGNAAVVAREAYVKFLRLGVPSFTAEDADLQLLVLGVQMERGDVFTAISHSGESQPIIAAARLARSRGIKVVAITNFPRSTLARSADAVVLTAVFQEHVFGEVGSKRLAQLCVLESLYVNFLLRRGGEDIRERLGAAHRALALNKRSRRAGSLP